MIALEQQKIISCSEFELYEHPLSCNSQLECYIQKAQTPTVILGDCEISLSNVTINYDKDPLLCSAKRILRAALNFSNVNRSLGLSFVVLNRIIASLPVYYKRLKGKNTRYSYLSKCNTRTIRLQASILIRMMAMFIQSTGNNLTSFKVKLGEGVQIILCHYSSSNWSFAPIRMAGLGINFLRSIAETDVNLKGWKLNPVYKDKWN